MDGQYEQQGEGVGSAEKQDPRVSDQFVQVLPDSELGKFRQEQGPGEETEKERGSREQVVKEAELF
jgi:hypothetical protein